MHFRRLVVSAAVAGYLFSPLWAIAINFQLPPRPIAPTSHDQCRALNRAAKEFGDQYQAEALAITRRADETLKHGSKEWHAEYVRASKLQDDGWKHFQTIIDMWHQCDREVDAYERRLAESRRQEEQSRRQQQQLERNRAEQGRQALEAYRQAQQARSAANTATSAAQRPASTIAGAVLGSLSNAISKSLRPSPPIDTQDKRDYSNEHDLVTDVGRPGIVNKLAREVFDVSSDELKRRNLETLDRMDQINRDLQSFGSNSAGRSNTVTTFTPQTLNAAIDAELNRAPAVSQQMRTNEAIDVELSRNAPTVSQQMRLNTAIDEELTRTTPALTEQQRINDAIDEEMRRSGSQQVLAYNRTDTPTTSIGSPQSSSSSASDRDMIRLADGSRFQGNLVNGKPSGNGILIDSKGVRYEGYFENGKIKSGVAIYPNGTRYKVVDGKVTGKS